ncbi:unnamed protein product [Pleuronectes platessa]|uniref:Uncharacterized protein n=1 Tax=Pleuronectes platessa TaxID=8262 RepID=A0A9N7YNZ9_PLEPL|nr:unnamed protein product [Pleuronectes platessa]
MLRVLDRAEHACGPAPDSRIRSAQPGDPPTGPPHHPGSARREAGSHVRLPSCWPSAEPPPESWAYPRPPRRQTSRLPWPWSLRHTCTRFRPLLSLAGGMPFQPKAYLRAPRFPHCPFPPAPLLPPVVHHVAHNTRSPSLLLLLPGAPLASFADTHVASCAAHSECSLTTQRPGPCRKGVSTFSSLASFSSNLPDSFARVPQHLPNLVPFVSSPSCYFFATPGPGHRGIPVYILTRKPLKFPTLAVIGETRRLPRGHARSRLSSRSGSSSGRSHLRKAAEGSAGVLPSAQTLIDTTPPRPLPDGPLPAAALSTTPTLPDLARLHRPTRTPSGGLLQASGY